MTPIPSALPALPAHVGLTVLDERTRLTCTRCGEYIELDDSLEHFEQAAYTNPQPSWVLVAMDMLGGFLQQHRECEE